METIKNIETLIRKLKELGEGDEKVKSFIQKQLKPYALERVVRKQKMYEAMPIITQLEMESDGREDVQALIQKEFFDEWN